MLSSFQNPLLHSSVLKKEAEFVNAGEAIVVYRARGGTVGAADSDSYNDGDVKGDDEEKTTGNETLCACA